jgi:ribosome-binding factor A
LGKWASARLKGGVADWWQTGEMPPRGKSSRNSRGGVGSARPYQRTVRVNESLRQVIAETLEDLDDDRLNMVTITGVDVDPDFRHGVVYFSAIFTSVPQSEVVEALEENRIRMQAAVGREVRLKRTPLLTFKPDPAIDEGQRIDAIIKNLPPQPAEPEAVSAPQEPQQSNPEPGTAELQQ